MRNAGDEKKMSGGEPDSFDTIEGEYRHEIKVLGSRFLAFARGADSVDEFRAYLDALTGEHHSAAHHCYAYRIGPTGGEFRFHDDGEPAGTAGKRIISVMEKHGLVNVCVVVVRYFGGTKLGMGGLSHAYSAVTNQVLSLAVRLRRYVYDRIEVDFPYDLTSQVHHLMDQYGAETTNREYPELARYTVRIRSSFSKRFADDLSNLLKCGSGIRIIPR